MTPKPIPPGPNQESVWDYPRPPRLERVAERIRIRFGGLVLADSVAAWRVLETSHPPTYYLPPGDIVAGALVPAGQGSVCEWKGPARYFDVTSGGRRAERAAWTYPAPLPGFAPLADYVAFYAGAMEACFVGEERAEPQPGGFYGGWVTSRVVGPFKGGPGSWGW
ncbi:DUF427 domain-containing protein [Lichenibacterium ramalinae]|uniref:DUF427 domain-containing protein n=1 Tax=Lichenibacterium ramalinae TaxID=2316527 RepID=A0A4Q2RAX8_9HYPH|nr:DUF427 domain-containing protein [Lichenibacterium ramalinae]RYB02058.1 DUF427 domain-containing protein [Lichenibacterium ramalinae]